MASKKLSPSTTDGAPGGEEDFRPYPAGKALARRVAPPVEAEEADRLADVMWAVLVLYVALVGVPVAGGIWAAVVVAHRLRHG